MSPWTWARTTVVRVAVCWMLSALRSWVLHVDVGYAAAFWILTERFVFRDVGVFGDDVPGVEETGEEAQTAEGEINEGVDGAETRLDPDCGKVSMWL